MWSCGVMLYVMLSAQYPFGRPEDTNLKTARQMHVMLQVRPPGLHCSSRFCLTGGASTKAYGTLKCPEPHAPCAAQRILSVDYVLPYNKAVSDECKDLLQRILVAEPKQRITMADIQRHPWFTRDLPEGVAQMNDQLLAQQAHLLGQPGGY